MPSIHDFKNVTDSLGVYPNELGVVMLDFEPIEDIGIPEEWKYYTSDPDEWWVKGWVGDRAHVSLKYGLLDSPTEIKNEIEALIGELSLPKVTAIDVTAFHGPTAPYAAIVLKVEVTPELLEFHRRLSYLPHIDTFTPWVPHVTMVYVRSENATQAESFVRNVLLGRTLVPTGINLGEEKY